MADKTKRTSSYKAQKAYDRLLSECTISSLRFLSEKYENELDYFKKNNDLNIQENWRAYKDKQQLKKMIDEELTVRIMNASATKSNYYSSYFDSDTGQIIDESGGNILGVAEFDEYEENVTIRNYEGDITNIYGEGKRKRKEVYDEWEY